MKDPQPSEMALCAAAASLRATASNAWPCGVQKKLQAAVKVPHTAWTSAETGSFTEMEIGSGTYCLKTRSVLPNLK